MSDDPYAALGLTKSATDAEIKKAYRKVARVCHPDLNPDDADAEKKFKAASAAYDLLKDPETRARFDRGEIDSSGQERPERQFYREYAEQPGNPYRSRTHRAQSGEFDASDIFADFMRQRGQAGGDFGNRGFDARGPDRHYSMKVPFLDAVKGGSTQIVLPEGGALDVKIPEGTSDGQTLRLRGKGGAGYGNGPSGDALVTVMVQDHPLFRRESDDIVITLPITLDEAVLGGKVPAPTISGTVNLTIPKGANSGQTLRLRGRGVKGKGDQRVELSIVSPPKIDEALADFMEEWRKDNAYDPRRGVKV
jgi:DnaJ-class molecular chaperone